MVSRIVTVSTVHASPVAQPTLPPCRPLLLPRGGPPGAYDARGSTFPRFPGDLATGAGRRAGPPKRIRYDHVRVTSGHNSSPGHAAATWHNIPRMKPQPCAPQRWRALRTARALRAVWRTCAGTKSSRPYVLVHGGATSGSGHGRRLLGATYSRSIDTIYASSPGCFTHHAECLPASWRPPPFY